ncbi:unnamed protein product [Linum tenue]|uniref:Uncharacterized protein n=1 Tax=Linum tenue TaxID=586396 RepID=A0AAV0L1N5_9ROSI|nr:unnamed protein product [Linum tenue]
MSRSAATTYQRDRTSTSTCGPWRGSWKRTWT